MDFESASPTLQADPNKNQRGYFRKPVSVAISPSRAKRKKLRAVFTYDDGSKSTTNFGGIKENGEPYEDFTIHKDPERKKRYIKRHKKNEDWTDPTKPGTLSRYVLWGDEDLQKSIQQYKRRFNLD